MASSTSKGKAMHTKRFLLRNSGMICFNQTWATNWPKSDSSSPVTFSKLKRSHAGSEKSYDNDDAEEISAAQVFHNTIKVKAEIGQVTGDLILGFEEVLVLTTEGDMIWTCSQISWDCGGKHMITRFFTIHCPALLVIQGWPAVLFIVRIHFLFQISHKYQVIFWIPVGPQYPIPTRSDLTSISDVLRVPDLHRVWRRFRRWLQNQTDYFL